MKNLKMQAYQKFRIFPLWCCCMMYILEKLKYFPKNKIFMKYPTEKAFYSEI